MRKRTALGAGALLLLAGSLAFAQFRMFGGGSDPEVRNAPYDGRFTFVRLKYTTAPGGYWYQGIPSWAHGYPLSEDNLVRIMNEVSYLGARIDAYNVFALDDPELFRYPLAYITEAGWWTMTDEEGAAFREVPAEGRLRDLRRLQGGRRLWPRRGRMGELRREHQARASWRPRR